jgi:hypothetical protein
VAYTVLSTAIYFANVLAWGPREHVSARAIGAVVFGVLTGVTRYFLLRRRDRQGSLTTETREPRPYAPACSPVERIGFMSQIVSILVLLL